MVQLSSTTVLDVMEGQQAAAQACVVVVAIMQKGMIQVDGDDGQLRDRVEVIVGQCD